jgi:type II secretory pathway component PulF
VLLGLLLAAAGVVLWPSPWADPGRALWWEARQSQAAALSPPARASDVAVAARLLVITLRAGLPLTEAVRRAADHCPTELARDLLRVVSAYDRTPDDPVRAWQSAPDIWSPIAAAMAVSQQAGVAPGSLLHAAAGAVLRRESVSRESAIAGVSVRLVLPLGLVLLPAFMCTTVLPLLLVLARGYLT